MSQFLFTCALSSTSERPYIQTVVRKVTKFSRCRGGCGANWQPTTGQADGIGWTWNLEPMRPKRSRDDIFDATAWLMPWYVLYHLLKSTFAGSLGRAVPSPWLVIVLVPFHPFLRFLRFVDPKACSARSGPRLDSIVLVHSTIHYLSSQGKTSWLGIPDLRHRGDMVGIFLKHRILFQLRVAVIHKRS